MPGLLEREASSLFSTAVFRPVIEGGTAGRANHLVSRLQSALGLARYMPRRVVVEAAYEVLRREYRSEYFYKNLIANKVFIGNHRASNSVLLHEFRVDGSIADCVFVNGDATVYEIKTEFDSPDKLERQLASYYRAFDRVNVVAHASTVHRYLPLLADTPTGLITVGPRQQLTQKKAANPSAASLNVKAMFDALRLGEITSILNRQLGGTPAVPNGLRYEAFLEAARKIPPATFQREMQRELKSRSIRHCRTLVLDKSSAPLSAILIQLDPNGRQQRNLLDWLATKESDRVLPVPAWQTVRASRAQRTEPAPR